MKKNLLYTILVGFLIITLPCFAGDYYLKSSAYQAYTNRFQSLKRYAEDYPATLLTPVSIVPITHNPVYSSAWHVTFQPEPFDIVQFASVFDPEMQDKILDFILNEVENRNSVGDLISHSLFVPVWVYGNSGVNFRRWVQDIKISNQRNCPDYRHSNTLPSAWPKIKQYDKVQFPLHAFLQLSVVKADDDKLPPNPLPYPPFPPKLSIVKADDDKLPPNPLPYPPFPPKLSIVKADDDKLPPNPLPYPPFPPKLSIVKADDDKLPPNPLPYPPFPPKLSIVKAEGGSQLYQHQDSWSAPAFSVLWERADDWSFDDPSYYTYPELYFVVWPIAAPEQREFNGIIDGYGEVGCEQGDTVEVVLWVPF